VCLFVELHPSQLNVNIHPAKTEVRFRDDPSVYDLVRGGLQRRATPGWLTASQVAEDGVTYGEEPHAGFSLVGQVEATFLLTLSEGHLYLLDQHAAEERVLYERLKNGQVQSRPLISPQVVQLSAEEHAFFDTQAEAFAACGFSAELFGPHVLALRAIPEFLDPRTSGLTFSRLVTRVRTQKEDLHQALSCLGAIKAGQVLDREGVGAVMRLAMREGRATRPDIKLGICGEHGGEPSSVEFCHQLGLDYVSCSPYRVAIARLASAQAALREDDQRPMAKPKKKTASARSRARRVPAATSPSKARGRSRKSPSRR